MDDRLPSGFVLGDQHQASAVALQLRAQQRCQFRLVDLRVDLEDVLQDDERMTAAEFEHPGWRGEIFHVFLQLFFREVVDAESEIPVVHRGSVPVEGAIQLDQPGRPCGIP
jgi:hypothetical protein